jgi:hypothetical protein
MLRVRTAAIDADIAAPKLAAERAGTTLACLFSSSDEFEAEVIRARRAQGALAPKPSMIASLMRVLIFALLVAAFLMI